MSLNDAIIVAIDHTQETQLKHQIGEFIMTLHLRILPPIYDHLICGRRRRNRGSAAGCAGTR